MNGDVFYTHVFIVCFILLIFIQTVIFLSQVNVVNSLNKINATLIEKGD